MKVTLYYEGAAGCADFDDDVKMEDLILFRVIKLNRVPNVGEVVNLMIGDYWIEGEVKQVFTTYCEPGNPHIKERSYGDSYAITLHRCRINERYNRK